VFIIEHLLVLTRYIKTHSIEYNREINIRDVVSVFDSSVKLRAVNLTVGQLSL